MRPNLHLFFGALCALATAAAPAWADGPARAERRVLAMGTELALIVEAPERGPALDAAERAIRAVRAVELRLSTWDRRSELSRLNAAPALHSVEVSPELARDLAAARQCSERTAGAFTPGMGALVEAWGLREGGRLPEAAAIERALGAVGIENLRIAGHEATRLDELFVVEEGAFGKGVGLDEALEALAATPARAALLDLGGQVAVWGETTATVELVDPRDRERVVLQLDLARGSVATTGNSERGIVVDGERLGHVIDPATGRPSADFGSVTVWAERAVIADCLSTALYVMGPEPALEWAAGRSDVGTVVLEAGERGLVARATPNLRPRLRAVAEDVELHFSDNERRRSR